DNTLAFQSYVDNGNGLGHLGIPGTFTTGPQSATVTSPGSFSSDAVAQFVSPLTGPYSIVQELTIKLGAGSELNTADNTTLAPPEPMTLAMLISAVPGFAGLGFFMRRRKQQAE